MHAQPKFGLLATICGQFIGTDILSTPSMKKKRHESNLPQRKDTEKLKKTSQRDNEWITYAL
jgi:hypothetical protein